MPSARSTPVVNPQAASAPSVTSPAKSTPVVFPTSGAVPPVSAVLTAALGSLTATATATVKHPAIFDAPLGVLTAAATATVTHQATLAAPLGSLTGAATATPKHPAVLAAPLGALTATMAATPSTPVTSPTYQDAGTGAGGTGSIAPAWPSHQANDIALLVLESEFDQPVSLTTANGFAAVTNSPQASTTGGNSSQLTMFWCRATGGSMSAPVVADPGNHVYGRIYTFRGCVTTGDPWDVTSGSVQNTQSTAVSIVGPSTTVSGVLVVYAVSIGTDAVEGTPQFSSEANATLALVTKRGDETTNAGGGGGVGVFTGVKASAGATGTFTATLANSSKQPWVVVGLKPP